jgi:site-specific recombinase XerD
MFSVYIDNKSGLIYEVVLTGSTAEIDLKKAGLLFAESGFLSEDDANDYGQQTIEDIQVQESPMLSLAISSVSLTEIETALTYDLTNKDVISRVKKYCQWLWSESRNWLKPNLAAYRDFLLLSLSEGSTKSNLSTIRKSYERLTRKRDLIFQAMPADVSLETRLLVLSEIIEQIRDAIHPDESRVKTVTIQDESDIIRLTISQANSLIWKPGRFTPLQIRDTAIISFLLATGIRAAELIAVKTDDLRHRLADNLALLVRHGKGNKQRLIPYGDNTECLMLIDHWLNIAGISEGYVFQAYYNGKAQGQLTTRQIRNILAKYPIVIEGTRRIIKPHDLRRTYARIAYFAGMPLLGIQQNLGHADIKTTEGYIGTLDASHRVANMKFNYPEIGHDKHINTTFSKCVSCGQMVISGYESNECPYCHAKNSLIAVD